jgi:hypothetical protein
MSGRDEKYKDWMVAVYYEVEPKANEQKPSSNKAVHNKGIVSAVRRKPQPSPLVPNEAVLSKQL